MSVEKPEELVSRPEGLTHEIEDGVAVIPLAGSAHLAVSLERVGKGKAARYIADLALVEGDKVVSRMEIPAGKLDLYTRPKYDMFRTALRKRLPVIDKKRLKLGELFSYLDVEVVPRLIELYREKVRRKREERRRRLEEYREQHWDELRPIYEDPVSHILEVVDFHHIGDDKAKRQAIPVIASRFLPPEWRLHMVLQGPPSVGKNNLVKAFLKVTPEKWWVVVTRMTRAALDYLPDNIDRQILYIQEYEGLRSASYSVRITLSEGYMSILYVKRNEKTGELETVEKKLVGTPVFLTTTTAVTIDEDMENRTFYVTPDTSEQQTRRILEHLARLVSDPEYIKRGKEIEAKARLLRFFFRDLRPVKVIIPRDYVKELMEALPTDSVRVRRDFKKLLAAVMAMAALHQHSREKVEIDGEEYVVAAREDLEYVKRWMLGDISLQARGFKEVDFKALECMEKLGLGMDSEKPATASDKALQACTGSSARHLRRVLNHLVDLGILAKDEKGRPHKYLIIPEAYAEVREILSQIGEAGGGQGSDMAQGNIGQTSDKLHGRSMSDHGGTGTETGVETSDTQCCEMRERIFSEEKDARRERGVSPRDAYLALLKTYGETCRPLPELVDALASTLHLSREQAADLIKMLVENGVVEERLTGEGVPSICLA